MRGAPGPAGEAAMTPAIRDRRILFVTALLRATTTSALGVSLGSYDLLLWRAFRAVRPPEERGPDHAAG